MCFAQPFVPPSPSLCVTSTLGLLRLSLSAASWPCPSPLPSLPTEAWEDEGRTPPFSLRWFCSQVGFGTQGLPVAILWSWSCRCFSLSGSESRAGKVESAGMQGISKDAKWGGKAWGELPEVGPQRSNFVESPESRETTRGLRRKDPSSMASLGRGPLGSHNLLLSGKSAGEKFALSCSHGPEKLPLRTV